MANNSLFRTPPLVPQREPYKPPQQEEAERRYRAQFPIEPFRQRYAQVDNGHPAPKSMTDEYLAGRRQVSTGTEPMPMDRLAQMGQAAAMPPAGGVSGIGGGGTDTAQAAQRQRYADPIMQGRHDARQGYEGKPLTWKDRLKSGALTALTAAGQVGAQSGGNLGAMAGAAIAGMAGGAWKPEMAAEYRFEQNDAPRIQQDQARQIEEQNRLMGMARQQQDMDLNERGMQVREQGIETQADRQAAYAQSLADRAEIDRLKAYLQQYGIDTRRDIADQADGTKRYGIDSRARTATENNEARRDLRQLVNENNIAVQRMRGANKGSGRPAGSPALVFPKARLDQLIDEKFNGDVESAMKSLRDGGYTIK